MGDHAEFARTIAEARQLVANAERPMDEDEFWIAVSRAVRNGSVQAMRLYWEMLRADPDEPAKPEDGFDVLDELAELATRRAHLSRRARSRVS